MRECDVVERQVHLAHEETDQLSMRHSPGFLRLVSDAKKRTKEISVAQVKELFKRNSDFILIDTREEHEWDDGHIAGAIHLSKGIIERDIEKAIPDKTKQIVLYCGGGYRSALAADNLRKMGYKNVFSMAGGWRAWKRTKGRIERRKKYRYFIAPGSNRCDV